MATRKELKEVLLALQASLKLPTIGDVIEHERQNHGEGQYSLRTLLDAHHMLDKVHKNAECLTSDKAINDAVDWLAENMGIKE